jgi:hypothetical protein
MEILFLELAATIFGLDWPALPESTLPIQVLLCFVSQKNCDLAEVLFLGLNLATW